MRFSSIIWIGVILCAAAMLYSVKYQVQSMDEEISTLHAEIDKERSSLQVLEAEWAFLSRPERVRELTDKHLDMIPVGGGQLLDMADIPALNSSETQLADTDEGEQATAIQPASAQGAAYAR